MNARLDELLPDEILLRIFSFLTFKGINAEQAIKTLEEQRDFLQSALLQFDNAISNIDLSNEEFGKANALHQEAVEYCESISAEVKEKEENVSDLVSLALVNKRFNRLANDASLTLFKRKQKGLSKHQLLVYLHEDLNTAKIKLTHAFNANLIDANFKIEGKSLIEIVIERAAPDISYHLVTFLHDFGAVMDSKTSTNLTLLEYAKNLIYITKPKSWWIQIFKFRQEIALEEVKSKRQEELFKSAAEERNITVEEYIKLHNKEMTKIVKFIELQVIQNKRFTPENKRS